MDNRVIFVLGMGRSGTSALTRVIALCGASLPSGLLPAGWSNPTGHWEPTAALELNDRFLAVDGSDWYDVRLPGRIPVDSSRGAEFVARIRTFLAGIDAPGPLVLKDPRITALSPFWFAAARSIGRGVSVVIPVRNPMEVAASLATRDGLSTEHSLALWLKYNLLAEQASRGLPRVFVAYDSLLEDWRKEVGRIARGLGLPLASSAQVDAFLDPDLHRERRPFAASDAPAARST
jgi:hypothetical protein